LAVDMYKNNNFNRFAVNLSKTSKQINDCRERPEVKMYYQNVGI